MLADAKLRAFARLYESNGDLTALPADPKAAQQELLLRCERVVPQMRTEFGLSGSIAVANEVQAFERRFGSLHLPPVESKRVVLRPSEHGCTRVGCKCKCTLVPDNPRHIFRRTIIHLSIYLSACSRQRACCPARH